MPIDAVIAELKSRYGQELEGDAALAVWIGNADIERWSADLAISTGALCDRLALRLARGFHQNELSFSFCDRVVNEILVVMFSTSRIRPDLFWKVYLAFDEGEYYHGDNRDEDPVAEYTRRLIAQIVAEYSDSLD